MTVSISNFAQPYSRTTVRDGFGDDVSGSTLSLHTIANMVKPFTWPLILWFQIPFS